MPERLEQFHRNDKWRGAGFNLGQRGESVPVEDDLDLVFDSLLQIFNTQRGERYGEPEFGADLHALIFEPHDLFLQQEIRTEVFRAGAIWEPRVVIDDIAFQAGPEEFNRGIIYISIIAHLVNNPRITREFSFPISAQGRIFG